MSEEKPNPEAETDAVAEENKPPFGDGWPQWTCDLEIDTDVPWTVGGKQILQCRGDYIEKWTGTPTIRFQEEPLNYSLKILEVRSTEHTNVSFVVTGYKAGEFKDVPLIISDGSTGFFVPSLSWQVNTVIEKGKQPVPFGPTSPLTLHMPWWYWGSFVLAALIVILVILRYLRKHMQRQSLLRELSEHATALTPYNQFNKEMRQMSRKYLGQKYTKDQELKVAHEYLEELDQSFKLYLVRELQVPALQWSTGEVMREIKKRHKQVFKNNGLKMRKLLNELKKAQAAESNLELIDCIQLADMSRDISSKILQAKRRRQ